MARPNIDLDMKISPILPKKRDWGIGYIGAGFIMRDVQLVAYQDTGFNPVAIASRTPAHAREAAEARGVPRVHENWEELLDDATVEIIDIAYPPDQQPHIIMEAAKRDHIKGILAQKPLALSLEQGEEAVGACRNSQVKLAVNSNMRYDQSMRALKTILDEGYLGEPVFATIDMRAIPHWQPFLQDYDRLTILKIPGKPLRGLRNRNLQQGERLGPRPEE